MARQYVVYRYEDERNRRADDLISLGYKVERDVVLPVFSGFSELVYRVTFWK